ncbi:hypothetical protein EDF58_11347 [Novosphingobium sp. PhB57]|nr:hypothetical protein EDF58_11347 [Novosphingobium sp. PhB57]
MPVEKALSGQRLSIILCRIQHHFHDAVDITIRFDQSADLHSEPAGDRGAHLLPVKNLSFNLAGFEDILGKRMKHSFFTQRKAQCLHMPDQSPLPVTHGSKWLKEFWLVPDEVRPVCQFMDIGHNHRSLCGEYIHHSLHSATIFAAKYAADIG